MICFAWWGFPQYAARCVGALSKAIDERIVVVATRPAVPVEGMDRLAGCEVKWIAEDDPRGIVELCGELPRVLFVSGWALAPFNRFRDEVHSGGGRVICMNDANFRLSCSEFLRGLLFRLRHRRHYDAFFVPGKSGRRLMRFYGVGSSKVAEGLYSADATLFHDGSPLAEREKKIIYVGQFIERKNVLRMCRAFRKANVKGDWSLELYGSGALAAALSAEAADGSIKVNAFCQPEQLAEKYRSAIGFCLPSLEEHWGLVVHEAALSGCVLLLSNRVGAAEDLLVAENGIAFDPFSESAMTSAFARLMSMDLAQLCAAHDASLKMAGLVGLNKFVEGCKTLIAHE